MPIKTISTEIRTYDGKTYTLPVLDYGGQSLCSRCGKCCWDWKGNNPKDKCENLAEDMKTCVLYGQSSDKCAGLGNWPQPYHFVDLPPECGYLVYWKSKRMVV